MYGSFAFLEVSLFINYIKKLCAERVSAFGFFFSKKTKYKTAPCMCFIFISAQTHNVHKNKFRELCEYMKEFDGPKLSYHWVLIRRHSTGKFIQITPVRPKKKERRKLWSSQWILARRITSSGGPNKLLFGSSRNQHHQHRRRCQPGSLDRKITPKQ